MAGNDPTGNFDATVFRTQIEQTMKMGLSNNTSFQPAFRWVTKPTYIVTDPAQRPYNWFQATKSDSPVNPIDFLATCAVDYMGGTESGTDAGFLNEVQVKLTILDTDMASILAHGGSRQPDQVLLKDDIYDIRYVTVEALFTVDVYTMFCTAQSAA